MGGGGVVGGKGGVGGVSGQKDTRAYDFKAHEHISLATTTQNHIVTMSTIKSEIK